jgi:hypothetical protein
VQDTRFLWYQAVPSFRLELVHILAAAVRSMHSAPAPPLSSTPGEELDPSLEPLLLKQIFKQGGVNYIRLGDSTIEFSDQFRCDGQGGAGLDWTDCASWAATMCSMQLGRTTCRLIAPAVCVLCTLRFYITTSLRNPHYLPETAVKVRISRVVTSELCQLLQFRGLCLLVL